MTIRGLAVLMQGVDLDMGAKIVLSGQAKDIQKENGIVSFYVLTGPATKQPPRGLKLFGQTRYRVECTTRQWRRARRDANDHSELVVEGYLAPHQGEETGSLYIAVVATSLQSTLVLNCLKLEQLEEVLQQTRDAFKEAREAQASRRELEEKAAAFVKANESLAKFLQNHPELVEGGRE